MRHNCPPIAAANGCGAGPAGGYGPRAVELEGRHAVITGAAGGIGSALARRFAAEGATVTAADLDRSGAEAVATEIGGAAIEVDVADPVSIGTLIAGATEANGPIDL